MWLNLIYRSYAAVKHSNWSSVEKKISLKMNLTNKSNRLMWWKYQEFWPQKYIHDQTIFYMWEDSKVSETLADVHILTEKKQKEEESHQNHSSWTFFEVFTWHAQMHHQICEHLRRMPSLLLSFLLSRPFHLYTLSLVAKFDSETNIFQYDVHLSWWIYYVNNSQAQISFLETSTHISFRICNIYLYWNKC